MKTSDRVLSSIWVCIIASVALQSTAGADAREQWDAEILLQLAELRKAQGDLKAQVTDLSTQIASLKSAGAPNGKRVQLNLSDESYPVTGSVTGQVAIVEFSDFECPYCRRHKQGTLPQLMRNYVENGKVRYYFLDYPLSFHARAEGAAIAAACAQRGGQFWKMHDLLFEKQRELSSDLYAKLAADVGLDPAAFESCTKDPKMKQTIRQSIQLAEQAGVQGTPAFLIGRLKDGVLIDAQLISGARPFTDFERVLDSYLGQ